MEVCRPAAFKDRVIFGKSHERYFRTELRYAACKLPVSTPCAAVEIEISADIPPEELDFPTLQHSRDPGGDRVDVPGQQRGQVALIAGSGIIIDPAELACVAILLAGDIGSACEDGRHGYAVDLPDLAITAADGDRVALVYFYLVSAHFFTPYFDFCSDRFVDHAIKCTPSLSIRQVDFAKKIKKKSEIRSKLDFLPGSRPDRRRGRSST
jgi:hypothetical protein